MKSRKFPKGGKLFELWFEACGRASLFKKFQREVKQLGKVSSATSLRIVQSQKTAFYMFCMKSLKDLSNKNTNQLFWLSFISEWKGLSGLGLSTFSHFNTHLSRSTYKRMKTQLLDFIRVENSLLLRCFHKPGIIWMDNYAKYFARGIPDISSGVVTEIKLTAIGFSEISETYIDAFTFSGRTISPDTIVDFKKIKSLLSSVRGHTKLFSSSQINANQIQTIPPTFVIDGTLEEDASTGLNHFYGLRLLDFDIGSNSGFVESLLWLEKNSHPEKYILIKADQNIYWRYHRLIWSRANPAPRLKKRFAVLLGSWHPFKMAAESVWSTFHSHFISDAFFTLFPDRSCYKKPKLVSIISFFTYMNYSYPFFSSKLSLAIENCIEIDKKNLLLNLQDLFEFYIPLILDYGLSLHNQERSWKVHLKLQVQLVLLFASLDCKSYFKAMLLHLMQLAHLKKGFPDIYQVLCQIPNATNEEEGELALSLLVRSVLNDRSSSKVEKLNNNFELIHLFRETTKEMNSDFGVSPKVYRHKVDIKGPEVKALGYKFSFIINAIIEGSWLSYVDSNVLTLFSSTIRKPLDRFLKNQIENCCLLEVTKIQQLLLSENHSFSDFTLRISPERLQEIQQIFSN